MLARPRHGSREARANHRIIGRIGLKAIARQPDSPDAPYVTERHRNNPSQEIAIGVSRRNSTVSVEDGVMGGIGLASAELRLAREYRAKCMEAKPRQQSHESLNERRKVYDNAKTPLSALPASPQSDLARHFGESRAEAEGDRQSDWLQRVAGVAHRLLARVPRDTRLVYMGDCPRRSIQMADPHQPPRLSPHFSSINFPQLRYVLLTSDAPPPRI
jgi:hypothetical protein